MSNTANQTAVRDSILALMQALNTKIEQAGDASTFDGETKAQFTQSLKTLFQGTTSLTTEQVDAKVEQAISDISNLTQADVGLGLVDNFATASKAEAENLDTATASADKFMTHQRALELVKAWWADQTSTTSATLDTINEIAAAIESNQDVISALETTAANKVDQTAFNFAVQNLTNQINSIVADNATFTTGTATDKAASVADVHALVSSTSNEDMAHMTSVFNEMKGYVDGTNPWPA